MTVADTDVLIDALAGRGGPAASSVERGLVAGTLATTTVTAFELRSGARDGRVAEAVEALLGALEILPFDAPAAERAAGARRALEATGETIGMADYLIAGVCLSRSADLLTRNRKHFERVPELVLA